MMQEAEPLRYTGHLIRRVQQRHAVLWSQHVSTEVSNVQFVALAVLARQPDASQAELGGALDLDRSTITDLTRRLERRGVVERAQHDADRRRYALRLTARGRAELERLRPLVVEMNARLTSMLDDAELASLRSLLQRMVQ